MESSVQNVGYSSEILLLLLRDRQLIIYFHDDMLGERQTLIVCYMDCCELIPMAARSKAWVCRISLAVIAGSNPAGVMDVRLL